MSIRVWSCIYSNRSLSGHLFGAVEQAQSRIDLTISAPALYTLYTNPGDVTVVPTHLGPRIDNAETEIQLPRLLSLSPTLCGYSSCNGINRIQNLLSCLLDDGRVRR